jgi:hypothetical protein
LNGSGSASSRSDSALSNESNEGASSTTNSDKSIVDLDTIVEKWVSYMWDKTRSKQDSKIEFEDLDIVINWQKCQMTHDESRFHMEPTSMKVPNTQTLFRTFFTNNTDQEQEYSFKTERTTRQACSFTFVKAFARDKQAGITFKIPQDIVEIGGGMRSEQSVECGKDETKEEDVTWGVDSMIRVKPHSRTCAELVINELQLDRQFSVDTRLSGRIIVILNNKREANAFVKSFSGNIVEIVRFAIEKAWLPPNNSNIFEIIDVNGVKMVKSTVRGKCKFRLGVEQHVTLHEEKI